MSRFNQFFAAFVASIGALELGMVLGWTSSALPDIAATPTFELITTGEKSWIGSIAVLGILASCPITGILLDKLGRKFTMLIFSFPLVLAWLLLSSACSITTIYLGRFLTGFCGGAFSLIVPVFVGEISDDSIRGLLSTGFQLFLNIGVLFTYIIGSYVHWQNLALMCSLFPIILIVLVILYIPETPRFLVSNGDKLNAMKSLQYFRSHQTQEEINEEFKALEEITSEKNQDKVTFKEIISRDCIWPLSICVLLMMFEQLSAFNAVIFYTVEIFHSAGIGKDSNFHTIIVGIVQVFGAILSGLVVDRAGRRLLLLISEFVMTLALLLMGGYFYLKQIEYNLSSFTFVPVLALAVFVLAFSIGIGPLSWTIMGEILPPHIKGIFSAVATSLVWFFAFAVTKSYDSMVDEFGLAWTFWSFGLFCALGTIYVFFYVPETKGKSLEDIQEMFKKNNADPNISNSTIA